ncbi:class D sortase [Ferrimicrobium sp.]|uniref:class D sortase n=1 Tax=Ferrimicrobium sp. TaxID=2926050 RepID=UPI00262BC359|nr:class D sortase [Ferrimicrobium sp.]
MALGLLLVGRIGLFYARSSIVGGEKIRAVVDARQGKPWPTGVIALLRIPGISLVAPVEQGVGDNVLNVAVGHLPSSVMPGVAGTSIIAAHNVSWFSGLGGLRRGSLVEVDTPTQQQVYRVDWHKVVHTGSPVVDTATPSVVLEACWPLNALYLTSYRYLVGATLVASSAVDNVPRIPREDHFRPIGIPPPIASENLNLDANNLPMGSFVITGEPSASWSGSSAPYSLASAEVNWLIALLHAASAQSVSQLVAVSHDSPREVTPLLHGYQGFDSLANLSETIDGRHAIAGTAAVNLKTAAGQVQVVQHFVIRALKVRLNATSITQVVN